MADNVYNLKFTLSNGDVIDAGQITAPQGPKGDKGDSATIDANTLIALLLGSNGIAIAKNAAGDKVEVNLAIPETGPITLASTHVPRPAILINVEQGGPPHAGGISCSREVGGETTYVGPAGIMIDDGAYVLSINNTNDSFIAYTDIHGMPLGQALMSGGPKGNVKTLFGNHQSIYGSGNIDLYRHNITVEAVKGGSQFGWFNTIYISSSNTPINSITDFFNTLNELGYSYPVTGYCYDNNKTTRYAIYIVEPRSSGGVGCTGSGAGWRWNDTSLTFVVKDTVTTV